VVNTQLDGEGRGDKQISKIVLEHILVLAVAQEADRDETKPRVVNAVTLEVTPEQAEKLDLARSVGTLSLVLRNQVDGNGVNTAGIMKRQLLAGDVLMPAEPAQVAAPAKRLKMSHRRPPLALVEKPAVHKDTVEVIKGLQKAIVEF